MSIRIILAKITLKLGAFIKSLPVVIMKPDDLIAFSRNTYAKSIFVEKFSEESFLETGLHQDELKIIDQFPNKSGNLLLLGVGGGREAIPLARMGFCVTGVDFIPEMVDRAIENASRHGVKIEGLVQELSQLDLPKDYFDIVWMSRSMYSSVPTRKKRVEMVQRISKALKPGGAFICQFHQDQNYHPSKNGVLLRKIIGYCVLGNFEYEPGDTLWANVEFIHAFYSEEELRSEIEDGSLSVEEFLSKGSSPSGCAICKKNV
jgi:SAM-dependent methyltransferase